MNYNLSNRYIFKGVLKMNTGLHIGSGRETEYTDNAVIRNALDEPYIPGSSFKGVLRSTVEKILPAIKPISDVWSCQLFSESDGAKICLSNPSNQKKLSKLREEAGKNIKDSKILLAEDMVGHEDDLITEQFIIEKYLPDHLCDTCKVFGSPVFSSKIKIQDLHIIEPYYELSEVRDGVGIDRDTETAVDQVKFNFEVIPSQTEFDVNITLENVNDKELAIFAIGLREFTEGHATIGGLSSRGLGACKLEINSINFIDFTNRSHLEQYLIEGKMAGQLTLSDLFNKIKTKLLTKEGGNHNAQTITQ